VIMYLPVSSGAMWAKHEKSKRPSKMDYTAQIRR
jgi:hypothetical protein